MKRLIAASIFTAVSMFGQVSIGIQIGAPPPVRVERRPVSPGPNYTWVDGYWYPNGKKYAWHKGYWTLPPYAAAHWVAPRHENGQYFAGYWDGANGRREHDHKWDKDHDRDNREHHDKH